MLKIITANIIFCARSVKPAKKTPGMYQKPQNAQKIRFTQQQLTDMGPQYTKYKPSIQKAFEQKYKQKSQQFQESDQMSNISREKSTPKNTDYKFYNKPFNTYTQQNSNDPHKMSLQQLSKVRLRPQYLPISYLKQAQKIFHKYNQTQLREIAQNFSQLMRYRYSEQKLNYDQYENLKFLRLEEKLPKQKQVQQIYLIGQQKLYSDDYDKQKFTARKVDDQPFNPQISYTQNVAVSYLINRAPRSFATAIRMMSQIRNKFPDFKPKSFLDFGSGLSAGSTAFVEFFGETKQVYAVQPASKMRKLAKFLTQQMTIKHYQTLGQMSSQIHQVDFVYAGYVINQLNPQLVQVYLQALYSKVKNGGLLVITEYGSPFGSRLIHQTRKWAIQKGMYIAAPCPHHLKCPLANSKSWCHFQQLSGIYPRQIFGKLPTDQAVKSQKFSYLILQKKQEVSDKNDEQLYKNDPNVTKDWDRVLFPVMKRGKHTILNLCTKAGKFERRIASNSHGPQYKEAKKLRWGDFWRFGKRIPNKYRKQRKTGLRLW